MTGDPHRFLVPISPSSTNEATIEWVARTHGATDVTDEFELHLVFVETPGQESSDVSTARAVIERSAATARNWIAESGSIRTAHLAQAVYLANPHDHAKILADYVEANDIDRIVLDPQYSVDATARSLQPLRHAFSAAGLRFDVAPVRLTRWPSSAELTRFAGTSIVVFSFYVLLAVPTAAYEIFLGGLTAIISGIIFRNVTFETTPHIGSSVRLIVRGILYIPYLLWKIVTANIQISYLVLHPALPIDPYVDRIDTALGDGLSVTAFANSLTLTPGTLTVDAERNDLVIHSITRSTRIEILDGERERAIRFVFYGMGAMSAPGPDERNAVEPIAGPDYGPMEDSNG